MTRSFIREQVTEVESMLFDIEAHTEKENQLKSIASKLCSIIKYLLQVKFEKENKQNAS